MIFAKVAREVLEVESLELLYDPPLFEEQSAVNSQRSKFSIIWRSRLSLTVIVL